MKIHVCARCEGCGYVTGTRRWEVAWTRWARPQDQQGESGMLQAQPCPDCGGTGALIQTDGSTLGDLHLASRRGLPRQNEYAQHVEALLRSRH